MGEISKMEFQAGALAFSQIRQRRRGVSAPAIPFQQSFGTTT